MGNVIPLHGDPHEATQKLIPWYVNGTLEPGELHMVDEHLAGCAECRAELASEQKLRTAIIDLPPETPGQWASLKRRAQSSSQTPGGGRPSLRITPGRIAFALAAQAAVILLAIGLHDRLVAPPSGEYRALAGAPAAHVAGNILVMVGAGVSEQSFRTTLQALDARVVDGPTVAGAYVLAVPPARRDAVLADLAARHSFTLVQPIDEGAGRR